VIGRDGGARGRGGCDMNCRQVDRPATARRVSRTSQTAYVKRTSAAPVAASGRQSSRINARPPSVSTEYSVSNPSCAGSDMRPRGSMVKGAPTEDPMAHVSEERLTGSP